MKTKKQITERVKSFEDACKVTGMPEKFELDPNIPEGIRRHALLHYQLMVIATALNEGWEPDYNNFGQTKYEVYGNAYSGSCAGRSCVSASDGASYAYANVGFRLCFKTRKLAEYVAKQFENIYIEYLLGIVS